MRGFRSLIWAGVTASVLAGCGGNESGDGGEQGPKGRRHQSTGESWTVMVYMVSDNDLEPFSLLDLAEMMDVSASDKLSVVVQSDRAAGYTDEGIGDLPNWTTAKRLHVGGGQIEEKADIGEVNMADPAVLGDFIGWAASEAPADRYAIVFWDHGGAWPGFGVDESQPNHDLLTALELEKGVTDGMAKAKIDQFSLIGFDACLMSTFETAMVLRPFGEYLLASEETEPGHGWDYHSLQLLADQPKTGPIEIGKKIIEGFDGQAKTQKTQEQITLALTDLYGPLDDVDAAVKQLAAALGTGKIEAEAPIVGKGRAGTVKYGDSPNPAESTNMIDLGNFADRLAKGDPKLDAAVKDLDKAIRAAVLASTNGAAKAASTGLSIYFPPQAVYYDPAYDQLTEVSAWRDFLKAYYAAAGDVTGGPTFTNKDHLADEATGADGSITTSGQLTDGTVDSVAVATLTFGVVLPDTGDIVFVGDQPADVDASGAVSSAWDTSILALTQGAKTDYGYLSVAVEGDTLGVTLPLAYREKADSDQVQVLLKVVFDAKGNELGKTFYRITEGGPGELTPAAGSTVQAILLVKPANGDAPDWSVASDIVFDPTQPIDLGLAQLTEGVTVDLTLSVSDFAGHGDFVKFEGVL